MTARVVLPAVAPKRGRGRPKKEPLMRREPTPPRALRSSKQKRLQSNLQELESDQDEVIPQGIVESQPPPSPDVRDNQCLFNADIGEIEVPPSSDLDASEVPSSTGIGEMEGSKSSGEENQKDENLDVSSPPPLPSGLQMRLLDLLSDQSPSLVKAKVMVQLPFKIPPSKLKAGPSTLTPKGSSGSMVKPKGSKKAKVEKPEEGVQRNIEEDYLNLLEILKEAAEVTKHHYSNKEGVIKRWNNEPFTVSSLSVTPFYQKSNSL